jgi:glycosyltransferase involved in cell wall biosynthesis
LGCKVAAVVRPGLSAVFHSKSESQIRAVLARYGVIKPYFLAVSTWEPRKGLEPLIRAFLRMKAEGLIRDHKLLLVGDRGWKDAAIMEVAQQDRQSVVYLGFVDDSSLTSLYSGADAFIYPSSYEGFGMPVLEARACGARVVASDIPELREAGGDDAIYIAPSEEGIRNGILTALRSDVARPINWRDWSWNKSAAILAEVLLGSSFAKYDQPEQMKDWD